MKEYIKKHWIIFLLCFTVWFITLYLVHHNHLVKQKYTDDNNFDIDSALIVKDSVINEVEKMKIHQNKKIYELQKEREINKKQIETLKKQKGKVVFVKDEPNYENESYQNGSASPNEPRVGNTKSDVGDEKYVREIFKLKKEIEILSNENSELKKQIETLTSK